MQILTTALIPERQKISLKFPDQDRDPEKQQKNQMVFC